MKFFFEIMRTEIVSGSLPLLWVLIGVGFMALSILSATQGTSEPLNANQILDKIDEQLFPDDFIAIMTMTNYDKPDHLDSRYEYKVSSKNKVGSLLVVTKPDKDRGTKILMKDTNMWMFVPGNSRTVRLSKAEDFMGSAFSNSDLMDADMRDDYDAKIVQKKDIPKQFILLQLTALRNDVTYARMDLYVWKDTYIPAMYQYYSRSGQILKKMTLTQLKEIGGRKRPTKLVMESIFEPGKKTIVEILKLEETASLSNSLFNEARLVE